MNTKAITQYEAQIDLGGAIAYRDEQVKRIDTELALLGLVSHTELQASYDRNVQSGRDLNASRRDNDELTGRLLRSALTHCRNNDLTGVERIIRSLCETYKTEDGDATL